MSDQNIPVTANGSVQIDCDNNNNGSSEKIVFSHDNGTELMRIQEDGNVGIGTTSPQYKLHVEGVGTRIVNKGTSATTYATINLMNNDDDGLELVAYGRSATSSYFGLARGGGLFIGAGPEEVMGIGTKNETPLVLATDDAERMRITEDGKIGIGTTSPSENTLLMEISKSLTSVSDQGNINHAIKISPTINAHTSDYTLSATTIAPLFGSAYSPTKSCLYIRPDPENNFEDIKGISVWLDGGDTNSDAIFIDTGSAANGINCSCGGTGTAIIGKGEGAGARGGYFEASGDNYNALETGTGRVYLNGSVGIGTATPGEKLEVNGFTKLGTDAPKIKMKKLTGTTTSPTVSIQHGLTVSKIISATAMVWSDNNDWEFAGNNIANANFNMWITSTNVVLANFGSLVDSNSFTVTLFYEE